ncbi:hypothetical protein D6745_04765 [Candidatus Woesearchaeota archaeon]|nr:MAG: hypothetical protein D6745_04765 [Candidatus Woesearchaeota archaeon]
MSKKSSKKKSNNSFYIGVAVLIIILGFLIFYGRPSNQSNVSTGSSNGATSELESSKTEEQFGTESIKSGTAKLDFYVMSQCPYGTQVEDAIAPVLDKFGDAVDFSLNFIANENPDGTFSSLHGEAEVKGDIVQLCAMKYNPDKYMDLITCMNKNARSIPSNWESCAEENGLDVESIRKCYEGDEGKELLSESIRKSNAIQARGSPTMYLNGQPYNSGRDSLSFTRAICNVLGDHPECENLPACGSDADCTAQPDKIGKCENPNQENAKCVYTDPVKFTMTVLNDEKCTSCSTAQIEATTKQLFKGVSIRHVDISSDEGKALVEKYNIVFLPAFIFDEEVTETAQWNSNPRLASAFEKVGDKYKLKDEATGASHYADEEKQKEFLESIGVKTGDNKPQIDFFVMSYCPYGNQAEEAIKPVYELLKGKADFKPHYVIYSNYRGGGPQYCFDDESKYCSMHGIVELHQDIREFCVYRHMGEAEWFEFATKMNKECNSQNADTCWEGVADSLGLDKDVINDCFANEALDILQNEFELNKAYGVSGSPTIFIDGQKYGGSRTPEGFKSGLCNAFEDAPEECNEALEGAQQQASVPTGGGCGA